MTPTHPRRALLLACAAGLAAASAVVPLRHLFAADAPALVNPVTAGGAAPAGGGAAVNANAPADFDAKAAVPPVGDMPMWGGTPHRNMVSGEKNAPTEWDVESGKNIKWVAKLGNKSYAGPVIANGHVYVGTNNEGKKEAKYTTAEGSAIDGGVFMCFDEKTGKFLWQQYYGKLAAGRVNDWPGEGLCSTAYTEKDRVWYCTNRCEVVCLDVSASEPREVWKVDMMKTYGVFPHNMTSSAVASYGDLIYVITGNGVDDTHKNVVAPQAPGIICINKNTGKPVWQDNSAGKNVLHGQWSSVAIVEVKTADGKVRPLVIAPLGDAWVYAYDARDGKIVWKFDTNPKDSIYIPGGGPDGGRNEVIATPCIVGNRMYIANGQDPEHGTGIGHMYCVDITKEGDISPEITDAAKPDVSAPKPGQELIGKAGAVGGAKGKPNPNSGVIWHFGPPAKGQPQKEGMHRTISTCAVSNGLCYVADFSGYLHCLDADTGKQYWAVELETDVWSSPMVVDGKVYLGDGDGNVNIYQEGKTFKEIAKINLDAGAVYATPQMANGTLYVMTLNKLFAIQTGAQMKPAAGEGGSGENK